MPFRGGRCGVGPRHEAYADDVEWALATRPSNGSLLVTLPVRLQLIRRLGMSDAMAEGLTMDELLQRDAPSCRR